MSEGIRTSQRLFFTRGGVKLPQFIDKKGNPVLYRGDKAPFHQLLNKEGDILFSYDTPGHVTDEAMQNIQHTTNQRLNQVSQLLSGLNEQMQEKTSEVRDSENIHLMERLNDKVDALSEQVEEMKEAIDALRQPKVLFGMEDTTKPLDAREGDTFMELDGEKNMYVFHDYQWIPL